MMSWSGLAIEGAEAILKVASWTLPGPAGKLAGIADDALEDAQSLWGKIQPFISGGLPIPQEHVVAAIDLTTRLNLQDQTGPSE